MYGNMRIALIGRGWNGWHTDNMGDDTIGSCQGGSLEDYLKEAADGTPVYDADGTGGDFCRMVVAGPMVDARLGKGEVRKFGENDKRAMLGMLPALQGGFRTVALATMAGLSSLDYVAVDVYLHMLREQVPGVKFGTVYNHQVVWETTSESN